VATNEGRAQAIREGDIPNGEIDRGEKEKKVTSEKSIDPTA